MTKVEILENNIRQLSQAELSDFRHWFAEFDADAWDAQIESDAAAEKLDALDEEALAKYTAGRSRKI